MATAHAILMVVLLIGFPAVALWSVKRFKWLSWFSPVLQCYLFGVILANIPGDIVVKGVSMNAMNVSVLLAIPLLLFSTDFPGWMRLARPTVISFILAMVATIAMCAAAATFLTVPGEESYKVAGMIVGVYTGGTPNMAAIGWALDVEENTFILVNAVDMLLGGMFFVFLLSVAKPLLSKIMPPFPRTEGHDEEEDEFDIDDLEEIRNWQTVKRLLIGLGLSVLTVGLSIGIAFGVTKLLAPDVEKVMDHHTFTSTLMIMISMLAIGASFIPKIRNIEGTFGLGEYIILIFCVAIGSQAQIGQLADAGLPFFIYVGFVMFGAVILHWTLCAIFRIDVDTAIITSTAAIYGPPFIGPVAGALKNREIIVSGITSAMVGIALGTQMGIALAKILQP